MHVDDSKMKKIKNYFKENFTNFTYFYSILRSKLLVVIILSIFVGFLDSVGLTMFLPLLQLADGQNESIDLGNLSFITNGLAYLGIKLTITKALAFLVVVFLIKGIVVYQNGIYKLKAQQQLSKKIRMSVVDNFPTFKYQQFVKTDIGKIQNIFLGEIGRLTNTFNSYISMIQGLIMVVIYMIFSITVDWKFAILVCIGGLFSNLIFNRINTLTKQKSRNISKVSNAFSNILIQYVNNFKYIKATGKILKYRNKVEQAITNIQTETFQIGQLNAKVSAFREPILIFIVAAVILLQINFFNANISSIMISLLFFYRALTSIVQVQNYYNSTLANQGAIDNIMSFNLELKTHKEPIGKIEFKHFTDKIEIKDLSFYYDDIQILNTVNLTLNKNAAIALVGESGSGKTTLVNIIIQLLTQTKGNVYIDGIDSKQYNQFTFQNAVGYISQEPTIFNDTIFNNVTFWDDPTTENIKKFNDAIERAAIIDFVNNLPLKEQSLLGNSGVNLSGGQRQRISIARELYKNVQLLILDEATSALDSETEKEIQQSIEALQGQVTIITIAHRLSTIKNADTIYLMDKGKIIANGTFNQLVQISDRFKKMVQLQEV